MKKLDPKCINDNNEQECNYCIVEFEDGVEVIPQNWLIDHKQAFWPPVKDRKNYYNAVKNMHKPLNDWEICSIVKILGSASTYPRALEKLSMAEKTSDISTESDCNAAKIKRRKHAKQIFSSEEELSESDGEHSTNKYKYSFSKISQVRSISNIDSSSKICATQSDTFSQNEEENTNESYSAKKSCAPLPTPPQAKSNKSTFKNNMFLKTRATKLYNCAQNDQRNINLFSNVKKPLSSLPTLQATYSKQSASNIASFSKTCAIQQNIDAQNDQENVNACNAESFEWNTASNKNFMQGIQKDMLKLLYQNNLRIQKCERILQNIAEKVTNRNTITSISDLIDIDADIHPEYLPAQTLADFHAAEKKWNEDKEYRDNVMRLFVKCKGVDVKNTTYFIMAHLMSNKVALLYSWTGAKQHKEKFVESPFRETVQNIIMQLHHDAALQDIKKCITDWLRHAKERHKRQSRDNAQAPSNEEESSN